MTNMKERLKTLLLIDRTCTTPLWDMPLTLTVLISTSISPSCKFLHRGLSKIFFTFCPKALSAIVKPNPIPPFVIGMVIRSLESVTLLPPTLVLWFRPPWSIKRSLKRSALPGLKSKIDFVHKKIFYHKMNSCKSNLMTPPTGWRWCLSFVRSGIDWTSDGWFGTPIVILCRSYKIIIKEAYYSCLSQKWNDTI